MLPVELEIHVFITVKSDDVRKAEHEVVECLKDGGLFAYDKYGDWNIEVAKADLVK